VKSSDVRDPTSRVLDKALEERGTMSTRAEIRAARQPHTREVLDVLDWGTGRIESTPHGFFAKMMARGPPLSTEVSGTWKSEVTFNHFDMARGKAAIDAEFPKGKRIRPQLSNGIM
jgi:hypothetical protein